MARYAIIDKSNNVINVCEWDGITRWEPPSGTTVHLLPPDSPVEIGGTFDPKSQDFTPAEPPPPPPPTDFEVIAALLVEKGVITRQDVDAAIDAATVTIDGTPLEVAKKS